MTISKGESWGVAVPRPNRLRIATSDAQVVAMLSDGSGDPVGLDGGDLFRTLGARGIDDRTELMSFPIDLVHATLDDRHRHTFVAHLLVRPSMVSGSWWRGEACAVMNAEFVGAFDVAPRGHPNDGRVEVLRAAPGLSLRQRVEFRRRLRSGTHLPHPAVTTRSIRSATLDFDRSLGVVADGVRLGATRRISIEVEPDAAVVYA